MKKKILTLGLSLAVICCTLAYAVTGHSPSALFENAKVPSTKHHSVATESASKASSSGQNITEEVIVDLWNTQNICPLNDGSTFDSSTNTITFSGSYDSSNHIFTAITEDGSDYGWYAVGGQVYQFSGTLESSDTAVVHPCIIYVDGSQIYVVGSSDMTLNESNGYTADFHISSTTLDDGVPVMVAFIVDSSSSNSIITSSDNRFYYSYREPDWMTVNVGRKGEFAQTYIEMTDADWASGVYVKITGTLNSTDLRNIKNLTNLRKLDLREADFTGLPDSFLSNKETLTEIYLPENLKNIPQEAFSFCSALSLVTAPGVTSIGTSAFYNCTKLSEYDLSKVRTIGQSAFDGCRQFNPTDLSSVYSLGASSFNNTAISEAVIPEGVTTISSYVFSNCTRLTKVTLPGTVTSIRDNAFYQCKALTSINIPEGITSIGSDAFNNCNSLPEITLPSTLQSIGYDIFDGCSSLETIKCKAILPPGTNGGFTYGVNLNRCTLYVAPFAIDAYREAADWSNFYIMKPLDEPVKNIYINRPMTFDLLSEDNAVLQENPNMTLDYGYSPSSYDYVVGQLSASGDGTLSAGLFSIFHGFASRYNGYDYDYRTTLVNNAENMRADSVMCSINFEKNRWHFISFQYDVRMEDIFGLNNTDFVIRQYDSENRASGDGTTSNWQDVPSDGVLKAGKGYIIQAANNSSDASGNTYRAIVRFPSRNTVTKNNLFTSNNVIVPLEEYPAEFAHNRSWNLVGNPYPCYYDMHYLMDDFSTPIVLWRGTNYQAYSPIDDDIILRPNESFFVQRPLDADQMVFGAEGRMHYNQAYNANTSPGIYGAPGLHVSSSSRAVFNFNIEGCGTDDRARIVINEDALMEYEINRDASKFFSESAEGAEIYVDGNIKYDICERPLAEGIATLGSRIGTEGEYTISLSRRNADNWTVMLTDTYTGNTINLSDESYTFDAEAGSYDDRFIVTFKTPGQTAVEDMNTVSEEETVRIVNTSGITVFVGNPDEFKAIAPRGIYIVAGAKETRKIVVK